MFHVICPLQTQSCCQKAPAKNSAEKSMEKFQKTGMNLICKDCVEETCCGHHSSTLKDICICYQKEKLQQWEQETSNVIQRGMNNTWFSI